MSGNEPRRSEKDLNIISTYTITSRDLNITSTNTTTSKQASIDLNITRTFTMTTNWTDRDKLNRSSVYTIVSNLNCRKLKSLHNSSYQWRDTSRVQKISVLSYDFLQACRLCSHLRHSAYSIPVLKCLHSITCYKISFRWIPCLKG